MRETMIRNLSYYFVMAGLILMCMSCQIEYDQMGFPGTLMFSKEGGEKIVKGEEDDYAFSIVGKSVGSSEDIDGYYIAQYEWLTVKKPVDNGRLLIITTEPNASGKSRKLEIEIFTGLKCATIYVKQK